MLMTEAMKKYEKHLEFRNLSPNTINGYMKELEYLRRHLEERRNSNIYVDEIELENIEDFISSKKDTGVVISSINRFISVIKGFYNYIESRDIVDNNPTRKLETYRDINKPKRDVLTEKEIDLLIDNIEDEIVKYVVFTIANAGLRISELTNLKLQNVDMENRIIYVIGGKGGKNRVIPINDKLYKLLDRYLKEIRPDVDSDYFFAKKKTGRLSRQWTNAKIKEAVKSIGWNKDITSHNLRHSFATNLIVNDVNIVSVQKLLGHSDLRTTSIYLHQSLDDLKNAVSSLDEGKINTNDIYNENNENIDGNRSINNSNTRMEIDFKYIGTLKLLYEKEDKLREILEGKKIIGEIPKYSVPGTSKTKSIYMSDLLSRLIIGFSETKNISQKEIVESAVVEYLMNYGYKEEVELLLNRK